MSKKLTTVPQLRKECIRMGIVLPKGYVRRDTLIQLLLSNKNKKQVVTYEGDELFADGFPREMESHIFTFIPNAIKRYVCSKVCKDWHAQFHILQVPREEIIREIPIGEFLKFKDKKKYLLDVIKTNRVDLLGMVIDKNLKEDDERRLNQVLYACESGSLESAKWLHKNVPPLCRRIGDNVVCGIKSGKLEVLKWMIEIFPYFRMYDCETPIAMALKMERLDMFDALVGYYGLQEERYYERVFIGDKVEEPPEINDRGIEYEICCILTRNKGNKKIRVTVITVGEEEDKDEDRDFTGDIRKVETTEQVEKFEEDYKAWKVEETVKYEFDPLGYLNILRWAKKVNLC